MKRLLSDAAPLPPVFIPEHLRSSPLLAGGGFAVCADLPDAHTVRCLLSESLQLVGEAVESNVPTSDAEDLRGGNPARRFRSVAAGEVQQQFYHSAWLRDFLHHLTGTPVQPTSGGGTYTYYARPGDHLSIHRDVIGCDVAVITCLHDGPATSGSSGALTLYPTRLAEPLSQLRAQAARGRVEVRLWPGQTLVLFGGLVPHAVLPVIKRQVRIVSVLCYKDPRATAAQLPPAVTRTAA